MWIESKSERNPYNPPRSGSQEGRPLVCDLARGRMHLKGARRHNTPESFEAVMARRRPPHGPHRPPRRRRREPRRCRRQRRCRSSSFVGRRCRRRGSCEFIRRFPIFRDFASTSASGGPLRAPWPPEIDPGRQTARRRLGDDFEQMLKEVLCAGLTWISRVAEDGSHHGGRQ